MKYKCKDCGEVFTAKWDVRCPKCGSTKTDVIYDYQYVKTAAPEAKN